MNSTKVRLPSLTACLWFLNNKYDVPPFSAVRLKIRIPLHFYSLQSMIGHCLGAAGGLEAIATVKAVTTGWLHPTINQFVSSVVSNFVVKDFHFGI